MSALGHRISSPSHMDVLGPVVALHMLVMVAIGAYFAFKSANLATNGQAAHATVVDMKRGSKGSLTPIVEFSTASGQRIRMTAITSSKNPDYRIGEQITVLYLPNDPSTNAIQSFSEMWIMPTVFLPIGFVGVAGGVAMWIYGVRRKRDRRRVLATGWHVQGVVVGSKQVGSKSPAYEPEVEVRDPRDGVVHRLTADQQRSMPQVGRPALVHVDSQPPHGYFIEKTGT